MTTTTDVIAVENRARAAGLPAQPGGVRARRGLPPVRRATGVSYLDLISGVGVAVARPRATRRLADAIAAQARELLHTSNLFFHPLQGELAPRLAALSGLPRAFFCNSGTEAVEACLKFARRYWHTQGDAARTEFVALRALVPRPDDGRAVGDVGRALPRPVRAAGAGRDVRRRPTIPAALAAAVIGPDRRGHRRADPGRGRRAADDAGDGRRDPARRASARARCSSPTKCSAASAGPACRSTRRRSG